MKGLTVAVLVGIVFVLSFVGLSYISYAIGEDCSSDSSICVSPAFCENGACVEDVSPPGPGGTCNPACVAPQTCVSGACTAPGSTCNPACDPTKQGCIGN